jgi:hypothetical protein
MDVMQNDLLTFLNQHTLQLFPNYTVLEEMGREIGLLDECTPSNPSKWVPFTCGLDIQDAVNCALSSGVAHERYPTAVANFAQLTKVLEDYNAYTMWGIDNIENGGKYQAATGTLGFALAQEIVDTAAAAAAASSMLSSSSPPGGSPYVLLNHYSGHDTTLMPLWMTLGNHSLLNPLFGAAMMFEFYFSNNNNSNNGDVWVRARYGEPGQLPGNHNYTFEWYTLYCVNVTDGSTYRSLEADVGCSLADWSAFIEQQGPSVAIPNAGAGGASCYFDPSWMPSVNCTPHNNVSSGDPSATKVCRDFRTSCVNACGEQHAMTPLLDCVAL